MSILSGFLKTKKYRKTDSGYKLQSEWTSSQTVQMNDGNTLEENLGAIKGITSSLSSTSSNYALSASAGKSLNDSIKTNTSSISALNTNLNNVSANFNNHLHDDRYYPKTEANVRYPLRNAVFPEQIATNALHVNTGDMFSSANYPIRVVNGTTANLPSDVGLGVRYTHYYNSASIILEIVGVNLSGIPLHYANYYNGSNWVGWYKI